MDPVAVVGKADEQCFVIFITTYASLLALRRGLDAGHAQQSLTSASTCTDLNGESLRWSVMFADFLLSEK